MLLAAALVILATPGQPVEGQIPAAPGDHPPTRRAPFGLYGSVGLGFVNAERHAGVAVPLGATVLANPVRLLGTATLLDVGIIEGANRNPRYYRPFVGSSYCRDSVTGSYVPSYYCSGGSDFLLSSSVDLSYVLFDDVWFSDKPGKVVVGLGYRFLHPSQTYATVGVYFPTHSRGSGAFKLAIGSDYVNLGVCWGYDLLHLLGGR